MSEGKEKEQNKLQRWSKRFMESVEDGFNQQISSQAEFTDYEKRLGQHLFIKIHNSLKQFERDRVRKGQDNRLPIKWENINMNQLILDAVHRINLGLDALIDNHIHPIPYYNSSNQNYDLNLMIGYVGKDYYRRKNAVEEPLDVRYELVHANDTFKVFKKGKGNQVEDYEFNIEKPFDRGDVVGGFGYIVYGNETKNQLVLVSEADFLKSKNKSKGGFWKEWPVRMRYKSLVHRTTEKLPTDPRKTNAESYAYVEQQDKEESLPKEDIQGNVDFEDFQEVDDKKEPNRPVEPETDSNEGSIPADVGNEDSAENNGQEAENKGQVTREF
ncbi:MAG: recombinase RecT [Clostridiales bacterium]|nr:recombinase RecT [Clostridiales bacterium]